MHIPSNFPCTSTRIWELGLGRLDWRSFILQKIRESLLHLPGRKGGLRCLILVKSWASSVQSCMSAFSKDRNGTDHSKEKPGGITWNQGPVRSGSSFPCLRRSGKYAKQRAKLVVDWLIVTAKQDRALDIPVSRTGEPQNEMQVVADKDMQAITRPLFSFTGLGPSQ